MAKNNRPNFIFSKIAYGRTHTLAIDLTGDVLAWGNNNSGQLGNETHLERETPTKMCIKKKITQVSPGEKFSLILDEDGEVWSCGNNNQGQCGTFFPLTSKPITIEYLKDVKQIATGCTHGLALLNDGTVWIWGNRGTLNEEGYEITVGPNTANSIPRKVRNLKDIVSIVAGDYHFLALKADGTVWGWGYNSVGQLGNGCNEIWVDEAYQVVDLYGVKEIIAGSDHNFAIKTNGEVWGWGYNGDFQIKGDGKKEERIPVLIHNLGKVAQLSAGYSHTLARLEDGRVFGWGSNENHQLSIEDEKIYDVPTLLTGYNEIIDIFAGKEYSIVVTEDRHEGKVWGCGFNVFGQFGDGTYLNKEKFEPIDEYRVVVRTPRKMEDDEELEF